MEFEKLNLDMEIQYKSVGFELATNTPATDETASARAPGAPSKSPGSLHFTASF
jgi:hypothetical protein